MTDVERLQLPTPFGVGAVNCYVLPGDVLTLIDPGPETADTREQLHSGLNERGYAIGDIETVLITHPHMDHFGGARRLADESGARVLAHKDAADRLADPVSYFEGEQKFFEEFLQSMGVPKDTAETLLELPEPYTEFQRPVTPDRTLADGDRIDIGTSLGCIHTPGHAVGSVCYTLSTANLVFTGDNLLSDITPNPTLTTAAGKTDERTRSLPTYLSSLEKLRSVDETMGYGGHGGRIPDLHERINETIAHHNDRKDHIAELIADSETGKTPYQLMNELFPDLPATEGFVGISEIVGHLDLLDDEDRLEWHESSGVKRCALVK